MTKNQTLKQSIQFTLLSLSAAVIEALSFTVLNHFISYGIAHVISVTLSVIWNFTLNRRYTFKSANNVPIAMLKVGFFYLLFIPITAYFGQIFSNLGSGTVEINYIIKVVTMLLNFVGEFLWWKFVVFRGSENTNHLAKKN